MVGTLLLVQLMGLALGFILLLPITTPDVLERAAAASFQLRSAVFILLANGGLTIAMAISAFPVFREYSHGIALWLLALSIIWLSIQAVDNIHILSLLSLSVHYTREGTSNAELFGTIATAVRATRRWSHYTTLLAIDTWFVVLYSALFRFRLVPRVLAGFGLSMVCVHTAGITLPVFAGFSSVLPLAYSMTLSYLALGLWLVVKGFDESHRRLRTEADALELDPR